MKLVISDGPESGQVDSEPSLLTELKVGLDIRLLASREIGVEKLAKNC